jgi:hypothetical protein
MNIKRFLTMLVVLVTLLAGFLASLGSSRSSSAVAQEQQVSAPGSRLVANEPAVRMWSGAIQYSDNNYPDFRLHITVPSKQGVAAECMSEENANPRRWGGCIQ